MNDKESKKEMSVAIYQLVSRLPDAGDVDLVEKERLKGKLDTAFKFIIGLSRNEFCRLTTYQDDSEENKKWLKKALRDATLQGMDALREKKMV